MFFSLPKKPPTKINSSVPSPVSTTGPKQNTQKNFCVENALETLQAKKRAAESKEAKVKALEEKLISVEASDKDGTLEVLRGRWAEAIKGTLREIEEHPNCPKKQDGSKMSIGDIITALGIDASAVGYDLEEEDFV